MKRSILYSILTVGLMFIIPSLYAQESSYPIEEGEKEKRYYNSSYDDERPPASADSTTVRANTNSARTTENQRSSEKPQGKKDDDVLSFNFLYYIIQKYKMSDIVDQ